MKKMILFSVFFLLVTLAVFGQVYYTKNGKINFNATSKDSPEKIEAVNRTATCVLDTKTGNLQFSVPIKGFEFERAAMQEHFNEDYMESGKFKNSEFKGVVVNNSEIKYAVNGTYTVKVNGKLTLHGITRDVQSEGKLIISGGKINTVADFNVLLADYNITIPGLVADKVSKTAIISVSCSLELFKG
jgi:hypothetical protein